MGGGYTYLNKPQPQNEELKPGLPPVDFYYECDLGHLHSKEFRIF